MKAGRTKKEGISRRQFIKRSATAASMATLTASLQAKAYAAGTEAIKIGLIGCGGRGTGAALDALRAATEVIYPTDTYHTEDAAEGARAAARGVHIVALADVFKDRLDHCRRQLQKVGTPVSEDRCFIGFNSYEEVMNLPDVNYVILATPPNFRPFHLRAAVEAGKHTFVEKPVAVDATGVRSVIESGEIARRKGLAIGAGTMRRRENGSCETTRRIQEGMIGDIIACEAIWSGGELWSVKRQPSWTDMEDQMRNWLYYTWLSGDFIVEQFVHNLDIINWVLGEHPERAFAMGGRQVRTDPRFGNIYDHFTVEYQFANGARCFAMDRQTNGCANRVEEGRVLFRPGDADHRRPHLPRSREVAEEGGARLPGLGGFPGQRSPSRASDRRRSGDGEEQRRDPPGARARDARWASRPRKRSTSPAPQRCCSPAEYRE